jgi:hypothetical protein
MVLFVKTVEVLNRFDSGWLYSMRIECQLNLANEIYRGKGGEAG